MCLVLQLIPIEMEVEAGLGHCCHNIDIVTRDATSHVTRHTVWVGKPGDPDTAGS